MRFAVKTFEELSTVELYEILRARSMVFAVEQRIICCDPDRVDYESLHCFLEDGGEIVGYLRAFYADSERQTVRIGRVLTTRRGRGYGRQLLEESLRAIKEKLPCAGIGLHSQTQVVGFYERLGFETVSEEFFEADVPHVEMILKRENMKNEI